MSNETETIKKNKIMAMLKDLLIKDSIPLEFIEVYKTSMIISFILSDYRLGENCRNISLQLRSLFSIFDVDVKSYDNEIKEVFEHFIKLTNSAKTTEETSKKKKEIPKKDETNNQG